MIITFPDQHQVDVNFDETAHSYVVSHKLPDGSFTDPLPIHGITAPLAVVPKEYLKPWAAKLAVEGLLDEIRKDPRIAENIEQFFIDKEACDSNERTEDNKPVMSGYKFAKKYPWLSRAKSAYKTSSNTGKETGTWLHSAIEEFYKSNRKKQPTLDESTSPIWESFTMFDNFFKPKPDKDGLEFIVYSRNHGYSGQGDYRGTMSSKTCIGDWKSTNRTYQNKDGISVEYFFQLGGLAQAEFERTGVWVDDLFIANFDKEGGEPRVIWASEFGMSPADCAKAYINVNNTYHTIQEWEYKFLKR